MTLPEMPLRDIHTMQRHRNIEFAVFVVVVLSIIALMVVWAT